MGDVRAAVDVGTNSVRLLVVDGDGRRLARELAITRLGHSVDRDGHLDDAALERTLTTLARYRDRWRDLGAGDRVRIAATSAVRDATDRERFFRAVRELTAVDVEVLSGEREARLSFLGASRAVDVPGPIAVLDVGGGSTELIVGGPTGEVAGWVSLQLGCVRLTERCLPSDPPSADEVEAARQLVDAHLGEADAVLADQRTALGDVTSLVGVAGTVTTLAALALGLDAYDEDAIHGTHVPAVEVARLARDLAQTTTAERARLGPVDPGREDVLAAGALIVAAVVDRYRCDGLTASESDVLDGLAASF